MKDAFSKMAPLTEEHIRKLTKEQQETLDVVELLIPKRNFSPKREFIEGLSANKQV